MVADKISVIIPIFNAGKLLSAALKSIVSQNYCNIEVIIIDGGSTDNTIEIINKYKKYISYFISEPDNGIYDAMNKGIAAATGTWLLFLGADDELYPNVLSEVFNSSAFVNTDLLYGKVIIKTSQKQLGRQTDFKNLIELNIPHQATFYHKKIFEKFKGYDLRYKILADYDLNLKIFEDLSLQKKFINKTIASFCNNGISNRTIDYNFFREKKDYFINHCNISKKDKLLAKYFFFSGVALVLKKNFRVGVSNILHATIFSETRLYYFLLTGSFILSIVGIGKRYKYV